MSRALTLLLSILLSGAVCAGENPSVAVARAHLLDHLQHMRPDIERFELIPLGQPPSLAHPVVAADAIHGNVLSARTCVWLGGRSAGSVPVWFSVKAYRPVLVSQRSRAARDAVEAGDFAVEERDVAPLGADPLPVDMEVAQMRTRHVLSVGHIVLKQDLEPMPQILRGEEVTVEVRHGAVEIETSAVALREARFGEPVTLQNPTSHMTYAARVIGQGRAAVIE
jgi:flagella basal body P-ring formation protein FlgA